MAHSLELIFIRSFDHQNGVVTATKADLRNFDASLADFAIFHESSNGKLDCPQYF
jgi:hypothetical protein